MPSVRDRPISEGDNRPSSSIDSAGDQSEIIDEMQDTRENNVRAREIEAGKRERIADERERIADEREAIADEREKIADVREAAANERESLLNLRDKESADLKRVLDERYRTMGQGQADIHTGQLIDIERSEAILARASENLTRSRAAVARSRARIQRDDATLDREVGTTERTALQPPPFRQEESPDASEMLESERNAPE